MSDRELAEFLGRQGISDARVLEAIRGWEERCVRYSFDLTK